jgi:hypothetical protein
MNVTPAMGANASNSEQVGYETNGKYAGDQVAGGVPLYAAFGTLGQGGGLYQNFGLKGGPDATYTGPVYAPTADAAYVNYTGPISGAPS